MTPGERASQAPRARRDMGTWLVVAAWSAVLFGLLEGVVLTALRGHPRIMSPDKVSTAILWLAPLVNLPAFLAAGVAGAVGYALLPARLRRWPAAAAAIAALTWPGAFAAVYSPKLIGAVSAAVLAAGIATAASRASRGREARVVAWMRRRLLWLPTALALVAVGVAAHGRLRERGATGTIAAARGQATNVLVLMLDTVRRDRLTSERAPNLARLAARGATFEDAWATSSWSLPSQASVLTGRYPHEHTADFPGIGLAPGALTLGEYLQRRGYATAAFSSNAAWIVPEHLGRGFVRFEVYTVEDLARRTVTGRVAERVLQRFGFHRSGRGRPAPELNAGLLRFLDDYADRPFFAYLCYMDVNRSFHARMLGRAFWEPRATPAEILAAYDSAITVLDREVGDLLAELERRGALAHTLVVVTSDHGESFGATILGDHDPEGHGTSLYPEQVRVPLVVVQPGRVAPGQRIGGVVSNRAIPATVAALLGDSGRPFPGEPLLASPAATPAPVLATLNYDERRARSVVWDRWQYIAYPAEPRREELFDLDADPLAARNLRDSARTSLARGRASLQRMHPPEETREAAAPGTAGARGGS